MGISSRFTDEREWELEVRWICQFDTLCFLEHLTYLSGLPQEVRARRLPRNDHEESGFNVKCLNRNVKTTIS